jgi:hypothetical protein
VVPVFRGNSYWTTVNGILVIFDGADGCCGGNSLICFVSRATFTVFLPLMRFRMANCREISQSSSIGSVVYTRIFLAVSGNRRGRDPRIAQLGTIAQPGEPQYWSINSHGKQEHASWVHPPLLAMLSRYWRIALTSSRSFAFSCQHFLATVQTLEVIPGASKWRGFGGRLPFEIIIVTMSSVNSGKGIFPVTSWKRKRSEPGRATISETDAPPQ